MAEENIPCHPLFSLLIRDSRKLRFEIIVGPEASSLIEKPEQVYYSAILGEE
jgi:hypothetical protein